MPGIVRVAWPVLEIDANSPIPDAVRGLGAQIQFHLVRTAEELINLCAAARKSGDEAVLFADVAWPFTPEWARIAAEAVKHRLPTIGHTRQLSRGRWPNVLWTGAGSALAARGCPDRQDFGAPNPQI